MSMVIEVKKVFCEYCNGTGKNAPVADIETANTEHPTCFECSGTGKMEIRKTERFDWSSCCPDCGGKGFNDTWDAHYDEHDTVNCVTCDATGGIPYLKPVE